MQKTLILKKMKSLIIINWIALMGSILWTVFDPGFESFITTFTTLSALIGLIINRNRKSHFETQKTPLINENIEKSDNEIKAKKETEVEKIAKRFQHILILMNTGRTYQEYTIAKLSQLVKLHKISELENIFLGVEDPSFDFMQRFCGTFGVNYEWLAEGKGEPYYNDGPRGYDPLDNIEYIKSSNPVEIYFIFCKSDIGEAFITLKFSDWKYKILYKIWHISSHVAGEGQRQILSMYKFIKKLRAEGFYNRCWGRILDQSSFDKLYSGSSFPGSIIGKYANSPWWDDFTDIYHKYPIAENYAMRYGKGFIDAQDIVRWKLEKEKHESNAICLEGNHKEV